MRWMRVLVLWGLLSAPSHAAAPSVVLVVLDGLGAPSATKEMLPKLAARAMSSTATWTSGRGVLPARTNPNHASLLTASWPERHGIVGNMFWDADRRMRRPMDEPAMLEGATLFDVLAESAPDTEVRAYFAKPKLRRLFGPAPGAHVGPARLGPAGSAYAGDTEIFTTVIQDVDRNGMPGFLVIGAADVDRLSHAEGPEAGAVDEAIGRVDTLMGELAGAIDRVGAWGRSVIIVTADHGFAPVGANGILMLPANDTGGIRWIDEGRVAFGHLPPGTTDASPILPVSLQGETEGVLTDLESVGLRHPRAGDVMLFAPIGRAFAGMAPGYGFRGDHGGEEERAVPFIVLGGDPRLRRLADGSVPDLPDVAATIAAMLGVPSPCLVELEKRCGRSLPIWDP